jgi:hypothetical protein
MLALLLGAFIVSVLVIALHSGRFTISRAPASSANVMRATWASGRARAAGVAEGGRARAAARPGVDAEADTGAEAEAEPAEAEVETDTDAESPEAESAEAETETDTETDTEAEAEPEVEPEAEPEAEAATRSVDVVPSNPPGVPRPYSQPVYSDVMAGEQFNEAREIQWHMARPSQADDDYVITTKAHIEETE